MRHGNRLSGEDCDSPVSGKVPDWMELGETPGNNDKRLV